MSYTYADEQAFLASLPELMSIRLGGRDEMEPVRQREIIAAYTSYLESLSLRKHWSESITKKDVTRIKLSVIARIRLWKTKPEGYIPPKPRTGASETPRRP